MLTVPYVQPEAFRAHPTYMDTLNLRVGDTRGSDQLTELNNVLLMASRAADNYCEPGVDGSLAAHWKTQNERLTPDKDGNLHLHADHTPVIAVSQVQYGIDLGRLTTLTNPTVWIEDGRQVTCPLVGGTAEWLGPLQFGPPIGRQLYTAWTYVAGFVNTTLAADVTAGATSITVADATGITAGDSNTPASVMRIWDPGSEEAVTVAPSYVAGSTVVPLAAPVVSDHTGTTGSAIGVSSLPAEVHLAIIQWATALLMRPNAKATSQFRGTSMRLSMAGDDDAWGDASGLVASGRAYLEPYRRVR